MDDIHLMIGVDQKNHFNSIQYCLVESIASYMFSKSSSHCYCIILLHHTIASFFFIWFVLLMHENYFQFHFSVEQLWISYSSSIMSKDSVRRFYGHTPYVSRFTRLVEASEAASSSSASRINLVILPPDDSIESEEEFIDGKGMPANVAGPMEVHEYRWDSGADEDLKADPGPSKNKKIKKINWRKCEDTKLDETFFDLLDCEPLAIFQYFFCNGNNNYKGRNFAIYRKQKQPLFRYHGKKYHEILGHTYH